MIVNVQLKSRREGFTIYLRELAITKNRGASLRAMDENDDCAYHRKFIFAPRFSLSEMYDQLTKQLSQLTFSTARPLTIFLDNFLDGLEDRIIRG